MQLVPISPAATWGGADEASAVRHREEMCCCWRNFKLGKSWDPSPRPCADGSLTWPCCSTSEPQTRCEFPHPLNARHCWALRLAVKEVSQSLTAPQEASGGCRDHKLGDKLYPSPYSCPTAGS